MKKVKRKFPFGWVLIVWFMMFLTGCGKVSFPVLSGADNAGVISGTEDSGTDTSKDVILKSDQADAKEDSAQQDFSTTGDSEPLTKAQITVFVCGEVIHPGVYSLDEGARAFEAIEMAGGFSENADTEYLNLAEVLSDSQKIQVYSLEQTGADSAQGVLLPETSQDSGLININTASAEELMTLPGIGESKAESIISYRESHGPFTVVEEIQNVSGIKEALFSKIKDKIIV